MSRALTPYLRSFTGVDELFEFSALVTNDLRTTCENSIWMSQNTANAHIPPHLAETPVLFGTLPLFKIRHQPSQLRTIPSKIGFHKSPSLPEMAESEEQNNEDDEPLERVTPEQYFFVQFYKDKRYVQLHLLAI